MPNSSHPFDVVSDSASDDPPERRPATRVLVLGAGGFLGQHVSKRLSQQGIDCVRIGRTGGTDVDGTIDLVSSPQHDLDQLIGRIAPTTVINCAGATHGSAADLTRGNVVAVHSLLTSLAWKAPSARLIQLGSSAQYGGAPHDTRMDENAETNPISAYGHTKLAASELVLHAVRQGTDAVVLRIFNVSGPGSPASTMLGRLIDELDDAPDDDPTISLDSLVVRR
jgi:nucleoside-diphosphate-sugar epimerase